MTHHGKMTAAATARLHARKPGKSTYSLAKARLSEVVHQMRDGDGLWYSGNMPWSVAIRIATVAEKASHSAMLVIDEGGRPCIGEVVEGAGGRCTPLVDWVCKSPGRWYWAPAERDRFPEYNGREAAASMLRMIGCKYGWASIYLEACWMLPIAREISYFRFHKNMDRAFKDWAPYCSTAVSIAATDGGIDPCPGRAPQWTTPQDTWQSWLWSSTKYALYPDEEK